MSEEAEVNVVSDHSKSLNKFPWRIILIITSLFIVLIVAVIAIFVFINSDKSILGTGESSPGAVRGFTKVRVGDAEFLKPLGWNEDTYVGNSTLFFKHGYLKDSSRGPLDLLNLDKDNGQVILYSYGTITPIEPHQEEWFRDKDYRWPKTATICDDLPFYIYGAEISQIEKEGYVKEYPYARGIDLFTATFTNLSEKDEGYNEDTIKIRVMCRFDSKINDESKKVELYSILYVSREEVLDEEILNTLINTEFF